MIGIRKVFTLAMLTARFSHSSSGQGTIPSWATSTRKYGNQLQRDRPTADASDPRYLEPHLEPHLEHHRPEECSLEQMCANGNLSVPPGRVFPEQSTGLIVDGEQHGVPDDLPEGTACLGSMHFLIYSDLSSRADPGGSWEPSGLSLSLIYDRCVFWVILLVSSMLCHTPCSPQITPLGCI